MSLRFHEIAEHNHRILNPFTDEKLLLVGEICQPESHATMLDLCCGKAEMLCRWSKQWGISGTGVDISKVFLEAARQRAGELGVAERITLIEGDAAKYQAEAQSFDIVSCIGATWIGDGLSGTLKLLQPLVKPDGFILVGEPYWITLPSDSQYEAMEETKDEFTSLVGTLDRIEAENMELVEMVLADQDSWDRYVAAQWMSVDKWLRANPDDPDVEKLRAWNARWKRNYLEHQRAYLGWGVFVIRLK